MKLNLGSGRFPLSDFVNLNEPEWQAEDGLPGIADATIDAVTISHLLMYVPIGDWPTLLGDVARVLKPGGVVRVTEDETCDPRSSRQGVQPGAVVATTAELVVLHLHAAGLHPYRVPPDGTGYSDDTLIQTWHGDPPDVFHVEAAK